MQKVRYPYSVWPGMLAIVVLIGSGILLKQVSQQPEEPLGRSGPQRMDLQKTNSITMDDWAKKIRQHQSSR